MSMSNAAADLANKIELHLKLDETPGYILSEADQKIIVAALRASAQEAPDHRIGAVLKWHFPAGIECDHKTATDRVICSCGEWRCDPQPSIDAAMDRWVEHVLSQGWKCGARQGSTGANLPQECNWPLCSCDPYADKLIAALQEHGVLPDASLTPSTGGLEGFGAMLAWLVEGAPVRADGLKAASKLRQYVWTLEDKITRQDSAPHTTSREGRS